MEWEWKIRITDIIMIFAIIIGPIIAVQITEYLRSSKEARDRKIHIFRNLMGTRSAQLAAMHIEALNLVELEFQPSKHQDSSVLDAWRLYVDHLGDLNYPKDSWATRKDELLVDMLYEMSKNLGYNFDKVQIKSGSYYPSGYTNAELEQSEARKLLLEVLKGERNIPVISGIYNFEPPPTKKDTMGKDNV